VTRRQDGFTLIELLVALLVFAVLLTIAIGFHFQARERATDAAARSNIRTAVPAIEAYRNETGSYAGMTLPVLQSSYSPGIQGIEVLSADSAGYCLRSTVGTRSWYKSGPAGDITTASC
jgi:prepilin-type N-terminal cleavage/methylation domain-containing protein